LRAVGIHEFGGREQLELLDVPEPKVGADVMLIRVVAAGVNPVDCKLREGRLEPAWPHVFPVVPGWDAAGVVERVGPAVTRFAPGDEVIAYCRKHFVGEGAYAEYVTVPEGFAAPRPASLAWPEAAALPLAGLTALQALRRLELREGETLLVQAAAGGVGSYAVQLAVRLRARVIGTAGAGNHDYLRGLGAEEAIDYGRTDVVTAVRDLHPRGVDAVLDLVGGETLSRSVETLRDGGRILSIVQPPSGEEFRVRGIRPLYIFVRPDGGELAELAQLVDGGSLSVHLQEVLPLDQAARAHELLEAGHVRGKLALTVREADAGAGA